MNEFKKRLKTVLFLLIVSILSIVLAYLAVFGRALGQNENHAGIALALPKVILEGKVVPVDNKTYLALDDESFIDAMRGQGFEFVEQMGAGYLFKKDGQNYISISRMYSSKFRLFSVPEDN